MEYWDIPTTNWIYIPPLLIITEEAIEMETFLYFDPNIRPPFSSTLLQNKFTNISKCQQSILKYQEVIVARGILRSSSTSLLILH